MLEILLAVISILGVLLVIFAFLIYGITRSPQITTLATAIMLIGGILLLMAIILFVYPGLLGAGG